MGTGTRTRRWWATAPLGLGLGLVLVACGAEEDLGVGAESAEGAGEVDLAVAETELGEVLVDGEGMTLYLFTEDPPGESVCDEDCQEVWPPAMVEGEPQLGDGVDGSLVSTLEHEDGSQQLMYAEAPLYAWVSDEEPGDVTGQDVEGVWFVVAPDGTAIGADSDPSDEEPADTDDTDDTDEDEGYGEEEGSSSRPSY